MIQSHCDEKETEFLFQGFTSGFRLGYQGPLDVKINSNNLKFRVGDKFDLWNKIMLEVEAKHYAGPYDSPEEISPEGYIVNGCGLVEKAGGKTCLIHHYSFPPGSSVNDHIPDSYAKVQYQDFQDAIALTLSYFEHFGDHINVHYTKTDAQHAFRVLSIAREDRPFQLLKAVNPVTGKMQYFADLCCGFGSRSSCFLYDKLSKALRHLYRWKSGEDGVVYLDDRLQIGFSESNTNDNLDIYLEICRQINLPISSEKTVRASQIIVFLGLLLDEVNKVVSIPDGKLLKALNLLDFITGATKVTVLDMQRITGLLNFFTRAIVPGRTFTRRLYTAFSGENRNLRQHHHVRVTREMKLDLGMWRQFLSSKKQFSRPFVDFSNKGRLKLPFTSDAAKSALCGYATCFLHDQKLYYYHGKWTQQFVHHHDPSVQFLELYGAVCGVVLFSRFLANGRVTILCDNQAVVQMLNNASSSCKHCIILIRLFTLTAMEHNVSYQVDFIKSADNKWSDSLSRQKFQVFRTQVPPGVELVRLDTLRCLHPPEKFYEFK